MTSPMKCRACRDPIAEDDLDTTDGFCRECYDEISYGKVGLPPGKGQQGLAEHLTPRQAAKLGETTGG